ncbi:anaerobic ribonucleoside-triphosphate reductase activating protein [Candidatus Parcubacteria bacterium]|nr:anaerobic ribonucleoside-triphosphate reductase activating protein [Candidatus Parcubacteria bacterium]
MFIAALQKTTMLDYPGRLACIVFLAGCNFKCPFCYSSEIVLEEEIKNILPLKEGDFFDFLKKRKNKLEAVVICGGEPTINPELLSFCQEIKSLGYKVKLDTNGSNPAMVKNLLHEKLVDYVALDLKTSKEKYQKLTGSLIKNVAEKVKKTLSLLKESKIDWEVRTTCVPGIVDKEDILKIAKWAQVAPKYYLQNFRPQKTLSPSFEKVKPYLTKELEEMRQIALPFCKNCQIR